MYGLSGSCDAIGEVLCTVASDRSLEDEACV